MNVRNWNHDAVFGRVSRLENIFKDFLCDMDVHKDNTGKADGWSPRIDIIESKDSYLILAEIPGVKKGDIGIDLENNVITLKGEKTENEIGENEDFLHAERACGSFQRSFRLPEAVDEESVSAKYRDGILRLELPKRKSSASKKIEIK
ncbi:Hsp20/alpha crystallin family protein [bacterium]|nr:Hsp20/alpha crystallin family protein [bacterium]